MELDYFERCAVDACFVLDSKPDPLHTECEME